MRKINIAVQATIKHFEYDKMKIEIEEYQSAGTVISISVDGAKVMITAHELGHISDMVATYRQTQKSFGGDK